MATVGSLFAGIGGFDAGMERAGFTPAWQVEIDRFATRILTAHWPEVTRRSDVRECGARNLTPVDVITFGSPCQDLSVAGGRAGLAGERSGLFYEAIRIITELRPAIAVWENVPGAYSSNAGRDFAAVLAGFRDSGARDIAWRTLDAQGFGVAQRRRRVFVVADFRGERAGSILFESDGGGGHPQAGRTAGQEVADTIGFGSGTGGFRIDLDGNGDVGTVAGTLSASADTARGKDWGHGAYIPVTPVARATSARGQRIDGESDTFVPVIAPTLAAAGADASEDGSGRGAPLVVAWDEQQITSDRHQARIERETALTLNSAGRMMVGVRRMTPLEWERLQGFPDGWTCLCPAAGDTWACVCPDSPRYRTLGNAVCVPVAAWLGRRIATALAGGC